MTAFQALLQDQRTTANHSSSSDNRADKMDDTGQGGLLAMN
ncbi:MAG: hypothetical protein V3R76_00365 [Gammaproteobacteria bacterium]